MNDRVITDITDAIATVTLDMPDTRNAISDPGLCHGLIEAFEAVSANHAVRCVILTGSGKSFCSGGNIHDLRNRTGMFGGDAVAVRNSYRDSVQKLIRTVWQCEVPVIAAVNGAAYGAGCDLAACCDIRLAGESAVFAENFAALGLVSGDGGAWLLPRQIGLSRAAEMTYTADPVDAVKALHWGLVSSVVTDDRLMAEATDLAARIARHPAHGLRLSKRLIREGMTATLDTLLELAGAYQGALHQSDEHAAAMAALAAGRKAGPGKA